MPEQAPYPSFVDATVEWFADALTWDSFQKMSDEEMVQTLLLALADAGYHVVCSACSSSTDGVHYTGCPKVDKAAT